MKKLALAIVVLCTVSAALAQISPREGDTLNARLIAFSVRETPGDQPYELDIALGAIADKKAFDKNIVQTLKGTSDKITCLLPAFNQAYTWRVRTTGKKQKDAELHHFRTGYMVYADTTRYRLRIVENRLKDTNSFVFTDNLRALCDLKGNVLWYLPNIPGIVDSITVVRDMHATPQGTISFLTSKSGYEIDYNGKLLWSAPDDGRVSRDTSEYYHHEFTRLKNGHYLIAGNEYIERQIPDSIDIAKYRKRTESISRNGAHYARIQCGTIIEYDSAKNIIWAWQAGDHFGNEEFFTRKNPRGIYNSSTHLNSFYFDEDSQVVYASFRDLSRIIKISYPKGDIIISYGGTLGPDGQMQDSAVFLSPHNVTKDKNDNLLLFNNNVRGKERTYATSYIVELREPASSFDSVRKTWEFPCDIDTLAQAFSISGGSVSKFGDDSFLASMGSTNRIFIVNRKKKVLWNTLCERKDIYTTGQPWVSQSGYKVSAVNRQELYNAILKTH